MTCLLAARSVSVHGVVSSALLFVLAVAIPGYSAENDIARKQFEAHLASGEFGPARQLANQARGDRDTMLQQIALAQDQAGVRRAAFSTMADVRNDSQRLDGFNALAKQDAFGGARGGAALADFDTLIQLIKTTTAPDSWDDAGGPGAVESFPGGVYVDSAGTLKRVSVASSDPALARLRSSAFAASGNRNVRETSVLRKVSLTRLERQLQSLLAQGKQPDEAMQALAGLTRIKYILVYPETRDVVVAGPAGNWETDVEDRRVNVDSRQPTLHLDDFVAVLRNRFAEEGRFGCSINPRQENLANVQTFLSESSKKPLRPGGRSQWLVDLHARLGMQDIEIRGLDPRTHAARVLVEADYRMKLVGMGLEPGVLGVRSYLDSIEVPPGGSPPPMDVLRWWFTLNYDAIKATAARDAFEIVGTGVKVLSENELLTERGERVHTGDSKNLNRIFAQSFTKHFDELATKYPIYAELRNVFDLALVAALIHSEDLAAQCDWQMTTFGVKGNYQVGLGATPKQVSSVINHREIDRKTFIVGVSGGVSVDTRQVVQPAKVQTDLYGLLKANRSGATPPQLLKSAWWWD